MATRKRTIDREAEIDRLDETSLRDRLKLAEEVCVLFGWSPSHSRESEREYEAFKAWQRWYTYLGEERVRPQGNKRLNEIIDRADARG